MHVPPSPTSSEEFLAKLKNFFEWRHLPKITNLKWRDNLNTKIDFSVRDVRENMWVW
jgi:hypothetical protein